MTRPTWAVLIVSAATFPSLCPREARADPITAASITGTGFFTNSPDLIIDRILPDRGTFFSAGTNVFWGAPGPNGPAVAFTIDLGRVYTVANLLAIVDNNDDYTVESSADGTTYHTLFTFLGSYGNRTAAEGGLDILSTDPSYPTGSTDATTPAYVGTGFAPTDARYLRVSASGGDGLYAIGELQAFTPSASSVPEPSSLALAAACASAFACARARRRAARG